MILACSRYRPSLEQSAPYSRQTQAEVEFHLPLETSLGTQLADYKQQTQAPDVVLMRFRFPDTFPAHPPVLCCARPRLKITDPVSSTLPLTDAGILRLPELSTFLWRPDKDVVDIVLQVHKILSSDGLALDTAKRSYVSPSANAGLGATAKLPTISHCVDQFPASCLELTAEVLPELADIPPGRVVLPHHCAMDIYRRVFGGSGAQGTAAFHVEIKNCSKEVRAFAGMAEVSALQEPIVLLPSWMMRQLFLEDGDPVRVRAVSLPLCGCVHLQPQTQEFYEIVGAEPELVLQESLAPLPALTSGLSIQVEVAIAQNFQIGLRRVAVGVARLEDISGNDVVAAKLPGFAGVLGDHEVRVELLPATDLAESGKEYQERLSAEAKRQAMIQQMLEEKHARRQAQHVDDMGQAEPCDDSSGFELCFRLPNGRQVRHRCPRNEAVLDLKARLFSLFAREVGLWKPCVDHASALELTVFPRRLLCDVEKVSDIGDRAVVHVTENAKAVEEAEHSKEVIGTILYPAELEGDIASSRQEEIRCEASPSPPPDHSIERRLQVGPVGPACEDGLEALPFPDLRALALSLGLLAADVARAVDKAELLALLSRHQRRAARVARDTSLTTVATERRASSLSARRGSSQPPRANNRSSQSVGARERRERGPDANPGSRRSEGPRPSGYSARVPRPPREPEPHLSVGPRATSNPQNPQAAGGQRNLPPLPTPERSLAEGRRPHLGVSPTHPRLGAPREPLRRAGQMMLGDERSRAGQVARSASPRPKRRAL